MRRLGDLLKEGTPEEQDFAVKLLNHVSQQLRQSGLSGDVRVVAWRTAQDRWDEALKIAQDKAVEYPESWAMHLLAILIETDHELGLG